MKAFVTSVGEPTTDLCVWSLERNGFDVEVIKNQYSLASKLDYIYHVAEDDFVRVDADVIVNKNLTERAVLASQYPYVWWVQFLTFDWFKQDNTHGGVQFIKKEAIPTLRSRIGEFSEAERPESQMYRLDEFENPRRCYTQPVVMGIHGYKNDLKSVAKTKTRRGQLSGYDFELAERLNNL